MPFFLLSCCLWLSSPARADDALLERLFDNAGLDGTLVIESLQTGQRFAHNDQRSKRPYAVASTFKIFNTLIALEEGVISTPGTVFRWDGTQYEIPAWNRDQTLVSAFKESCVWCYQQLARRVGAARYPAYIQRARYGQLLEPFDETRFWLDGSLTISAEQQITFLRQIAERNLPFKPSSYDTLKQVMLAEEGSQYRLYAKTGWATTTKPQVGWYVGYVETSGNTWLFALNLDTRDASDLPLRIQIVKDALRAKRVLPST